MPLSIAAAALSFCGSLLAKFAADRLLPGRVSLLGSSAGLERSLNAGIAFGIRFPGLLQEALTGAAFVLVLFLAWRSRENPWQQAGYGLILGGALANIVDRIPDGVVTDFFQVGSFPVFNVADSCITIGVVLLLIEALWRKG